jgi:hypothetical protein
MFNRIVDFMAQYRAVPTLIGMGLIIINLILQFFPGLGWLRESHLLLHLGVLVSFAGILLSNAL